MAPIDNKFIIAALREFRRIEQKEMEKKKVESEKQNKKKAERLVSFFNEKNH